MLKRNIIYLLETNWVELKYPISLVVAANGKRKLARFGPFRMTENDGSKELVWAMTNIYLFVNRSERQLLLVTTLTAKHF